MVGHSTGSNTRTGPRGLALDLRYRQMNLKLKNRSYEVSERKQVGDAESMVNEGRSDTAQGLFGRGVDGKGGEV